MRNILAIARTDLQVYLSDRGNIFGLIALPIIMTLFLGGVFTSGGTSQVRLDILDQDSSPAATQFIADLRAVNPALILCPADSGPDDGCSLGEAESLNVESSIERVRKGQTDGLLVIPAGYGTGLAAFETIRLPYHTASDMLTNDPALQSIQAVLQRVNGGVVAARVGEGLAESLDVPPAAEGGDSFGQAVYAQANTDRADPPVTVAYTQTEANQPQNQSDGFGQSVPGMATFFVVFSVLGAGMYGLVKERSQGTLPRLAVMPVRRADIIGGKILAYFSIGIVQFVIVFLVGLVVGVNFGHDVLALLLVMVAYTLCITALSFVLAPRMRNDSQISAMTTLLGMVMGALGGAWWPLDVAPQFMQLVGHLTPVAWAMDAFRQLFFFNGSLGDVLLPVGMLVAATAVLFVVGIRAFKFT
ncbi:MAG: ABC transporter permease [Anaerolineae bacterium]|nr:ABC transporter permease [Anaerolineae bacterium]